MKADKPTQVKTGYEVSVKSPTLVTIPSIHDLELYMALQPILDKFELIWELVLTNQPIVVMATSPTVCSNMVQALVSLIHPLTYAADYRPFFTIHDTEFKNYTTRTQTPPQVILGVTNPFFAKALDHWPHIIKAGDHTSSIANRAEEYRGASRGRSLEGELKPGRCGWSGDLQCGRGFFSTLALCGVAMATCLGLHTKYKPLLQKDKMFLMMLGSYKAGGGGGAGGKRPLEALNVMIKKQALQLTTGFITPLPPPQLAPFNVEQFLHILEGLGTQIMATIKGNWIDLYRTYVYGFKTTALKVYPSVPSSLHQGVKTKLKTITDALPPDLQMRLCGVVAGLLFPRPSALTLVLRPLLVMSVWGDCMGVILHQYGVVEFKTRNLRRDEPCPLEHGKELRDAALQGDLEEMVKLLNQGADINGADEDGWTALMMASYGGHLDCVKELLEKGALVNAQDKVSAV
eukprot:Em0001g715a